jgi:hypothetical protein
MVSEDQRRQLELLREGTKGTQYEKASLYTIILDLIKTTSVGEVFVVLDSLSHDLDCKGELEEIIRESGDPVNWELTGGVRGRPMDENTKYSTLDINFGNGEEE